jgi:hypothetical protein
VNLSTVLDNPRAKECLQANEHDRPFASFCADNAHIWKLYVEQARASDDQLANLLNSDLDPLLIFVCDTFYVWLIHK